MMKLVNRIALKIACFFIVSCAAVTTISAFADCSFKSGYGLQAHQLTVSPNNILASRDITVGTVLASGEVQAVKGIYATCSGSILTIYNVNASNSMTVAGLTNVFPSNIPGIGLRFYSRDNNGKNYRFVDQGTGGLNFTYPTWQWDTYGTGYWGIEVVVTGPLGSGVYNNGLMAYVHIGNLNVVNLTVNPFTVTNRSCDASSTQQRVDLGTQLTSAFPTQGSTVGQKDFSIELRGCTATGLTSISYTLTSFGSTFDLPTGVLPNAGGIVTDGYASGIGVKIMDGLGNAVTFGSAKAISYTPGTGSISIPFKAAMYRTSTAAISPGLVRSQLVFTMSYK